MDNNMLWQYVQEIFVFYDKDFSGYLDERQLTLFFNEVFSKINDGQRTTDQEVYQTMRSVDPAFNGKATKQGVFRVLKYMLSQNSSQSQPVQYPNQYESQNLNQTASFGQAQSHPTYENSQGSTIPLSNQNEQYKNYGNSNMPNEKQNEEYKNFGNSSMPNKNQNQQYKQFNNLNNESNQNNNQYQNQNFTQQPNQNQNQNNKNLNSTQNQHIQNNQQNYQNTPYQQQPNQPQYQQSQSQYQQQAQYHQGYPQQPQQPQQPQNYNYIGQKYTSHQTSNQPYVSSSNNDNSPTFQYNPGEKLNLKSNNTQTVNTHYVTSSVNNEDNYLRSSSSPMQNDYAYNHPLKNQNIGFKQEINSNQPALNTGTSTSAGGKITVPSLLKP